MLYPFNHVVTLNLAYTNRISCPCVNTPYYLHVSEITQDNHVLTYKKPKPKKNNEPNFDKLSDKEKARLAKIAEDQQYLMWKASR